MFILVDTLIAAVREGLDAQGRQLGLGSTLGDQIKPRARTGGRSRSRITSGPISAVTYASIVHKRGGGRKRRGSSS